MLLGPTGGMQLQEVRLPLSTVQINTAYSLLRTLRTFCCENPGVLNTTAALVQLPPVSDARSPYQTPPSASVWPVPQLPLNALSLNDELSDEQEEYAENLCVYHLVNAATACVANASRTKRRLAWWCCTPTQPQRRPRFAADGNYGARTLEENERHHCSDLKDRYWQRRDHTRQLVA